MRRELLCFYVNELQLGTAAQISNWIFIYSSLYSHEGYDNDDHHHHYQDDKCNQNVREQKQQQQQRSPNNTRRLKILTNNLQGNPQSGLNLSPIHSWLASRDYSIDIGKPLSFTMPTLSLHPFGAWSCMRLGEYPNVDERIGRGY